MSPRWNAGSMLPLRRVAAGQRARGAGRPSRVRTRAPEHHDDGALARREQDQRLPDDERRRQDHAEVHHLLGQLRAARRLRAGQAQTRGAAAQRLGGRGRAAERRSGSAEREHAAGGRRTSRQSMRRSVSTVSPMKPIALRGLPREGGAGDVPSLRVRPRALLPRRSRGCRLEAAAWSSRSRSRSRSRNPEPRKERPPWQASHPSTSTWPKNHVSSDPWARCDTHAEQAARPWSEQLQLQQQQQRSQRVRY